MKIINPTLTFADMIIDREVVANPGILTVTAPGITMLTSKEFTLASGQWLNISADIRMLKGGTQGAAQCDIARGSGTATVLYHDVSIESHTCRIGEPFMNAATTWSPVWSCFVRCSAAGTFVFRVLGASFGSDSTIAIDDIRMEIIQFQ